MYSAEQGWASQRGGPPLTQPMPPIGPPHMQPHFYPSHHPPGFYPPPQHHFPPLYPFITGHGLFGPRPVYPYSITPPVINNRGEKPLRKKEEIEKWIEALEARCTGGKRENLGGWKESDMEMHVPVPAAQQVHTLRAELLSLREKLAESVGSTSSFFLAANGMGSYFVIIYIHRVVSRRLK